MCRLTEVGKGHRNEIIVEMDMISKELELPRQWKVWFNNLNSIII